MKNACIVLRNQKSGLNSIDFTSVIDAFTSAGYYFNRVILLPYEEMSTLFEQLNEIKGEFDTITVICDMVLLEGVKRKIAEFFKKDFYSQFTLKINDKLLFVLPAGELGEREVKTQIVPFINQTFNCKYDKVIIRMLGVPQEKLDKVLQSATEMSEDKIEFNVTCLFGDCRLEIIYNQTSPKMLIDEIIRFFASNLKDYIYALDDTPLEKRLFDALTVRKLKLSVAESFTGGGIAKRLVSLSGISSVYEEGLNTYSNEAKANRLGVTKQALTTFGAVSDEVAFQMAAGLLQQGNCDVAIATTGIAGPKSDCTNKPVGLCYIAVGIDGKVYVNKHIFDGNRHNISETAINYALFAALKIIK